MKITLVFACISSLVGCGGSSASHGDAPSTPDVCADAGDTLGTWSCVPSNTTQNLNRVWSSGPEDAWAVGDAGTVLHWNGSAWSPVSSGTSQSLHGVWGSGASDVWIVGDQSTTLHWNGSAWSDVGLPVTLRAVWGSSAEDVWAVGDERTILHFDGSGWSTAVLPTPRIVAAGKSGDMTTSQHLLGVWGSSASDVWVVGSPSCVSRGAWQSPRCADDNLMHFDGSEWSLASSGEGVDTVRDVWGSSPGDFWVSGGSHFDGSTWVVASQAVSIGAVWGSGPNEVWALDGYDILHFNGTDWSPVTNRPRFALYAIGGSAPADVWAVGFAGEILHHRVP
jgi:hypothetical protein